MAKRKNERANEQGALRGPSSIQPTKPETSSSNTVDSKERKAVIQAGLSMRFSGPLPPPAVLAQYNQAHPDAADRILTMAEQQARHRQSLERTVIRGDNLRAVGGLILGFILCLFFGAGGIYLISQGHSTDGLVAMLTPMAALVGSFLYADWHRRKERSARSKAEEDDETDRQLSLPLDQ